MRILSFGWKGEKGENDGKRIGSRRINLRKLRGQNRGKSRDAGRGQIRLPQPDDTNLIR